MTVSELIEHSQGPEGEDDISFEAPTLEGPLARPVDFGLDELRCDRGTASRTDRSRGVEP